MTDARTTHEANYFGGPNYLGRHRRPGFTSVSVDRLHADIADALAATRCPPCYGDDGEHCHVDAASGRWLAHSVMAVLARQSLVERLPSPRPPSEPPRWHESRDLLLG